jgi:hypothetical protein
LRTWPGRISDGFVIPFSLAIAWTVVPNLAAIPLSVSPGLTV